MHWLKRTAALIISSAFIICSTTTFANTGDNSEAATRYTIQANKKVADSLPFSNKEDFTNAQKGLVSAPKDLIIRNDEDNIVWNMAVYRQFEGIDAPAPTTVNPSLWRQARLNAIYGLFKVTDRIYQVRGYDLAVMSIVIGRKGYIVIDPLTATATAKAAMALVYKNLGKKPVTAVIYTHSHIDHFGGVKGIISAQQANAGKVEIIAPKGFEDEAISENVMAGNVMARRATYMYGNLLPKNANGQVGAGLGKTTPDNGVASFIVPTKIVGKTPTKMTVDGVKIIFQYTPNAEAPAEMTFYFPQFHALCMAENVSHTLHNLYTLRGAKVRDSQSWAGYINQSIKLFGEDVNVEFASHHWPTWGNKNIITLLEKQRDAYQYIHDQTLRLANEGYNMTQIAEKVTLPQSLAQAWYDRGYYGTVSHNVKAVYQYYLGWFDANPAHLHPLPAVAAAKKYVEYMGGSKAILKRAQKDYNKGHYRWVAEVVNQLVFAQPDNKKAKGLLADTYEQLGYQAESGPWRNFYLSGALELRQGVNTNAAAFKTASPDFVKAMPLALFYQFLAIHVNGEKADGKHIVINWHFPDTKQRYMTDVDNAVLHYDKGKSKKADATIRIDRDTLDKIIVGQTSFKQAMKKGDIDIKGDKEAVKTFFSLMDTFTFWFNIVTPQSDTSTLAIRNGKT